MAKVRPCSGRHATTAEGVAAGCQLCRLIETNPKYFELFNGVSAPKRIPLTFGGGKFRNARACGYLGEKLPGRPCGSDLHTCTLDNTTCSTMRECTEALRCCQSCPHHPAVRPGRGILVTGGIGDVFAIESMMTMEERESLESVYYACPAWREVEVIFRGLPNYPKLRNHHVIHTKRKVHLNRRSLEKEAGALPMGVEDWSIQAIFPQERKYTGSSLLTYRVAPSVVAPRGSAPFVAIVPQSSWGRWGDRDFSIADWRETLQFLRDHDLYGVVLSREKFRVPVDERVVNLGGTLNILESVEMLKLASGYIGIDSCLSVLAAKLFPAERLSIKATRSHLYENQHHYYSPRTSFPFIKRHIEAPTWNA